MLISAILLHAGHEVTFLEYLLRVLLHFVALGGVALVVYWLVGIAGDVRRFVAGRDTDGTDGGESG